MTEEEKKNKTAADIYREEMSEVMLPEVVVVGSRPLDNIKIAPEENLNVLADPYKDKFRGKPSQVKRDLIYGNVNNLVDDYRRESMNNLFHEKKDAPVIHDDVPIIDTTVEYEPPTEEMKKFEEEKTQAQWEKDYFDSIWSKEDEEAAEKKKKAAQWITAAQMLGDSLTALGNSYFVAKGANNMGASQGAAKAAEATSKLYQDIANAREKAAKAKYAATLKKYEMEMQRERYEAAQAENKRRYDNDVAYRRERDAIVDAREKELMEFRRQQENRIAKSSRGASTSTKDVEPIEFTLGDGETIVIDKFNKDKLNRIYRSLPEDVRYATENEEVYSNGVSMGTKKRKVTDDDRLQAIYENLDNPEVADAIRRLAGVKTIAPKEGEVKSEVVVDPLTGKSYSVNPENPVIGGTQTKKPNPMNS